MSLIATLRPTNRSFASLFPYIVTTCVGQWMAIVQGTKVLNPIQYAPQPPNFVVSSSITVKSGVLIEFDKFFFKTAKKSFENDVTKDL